MFPHFYKRPDVEAQRRYCDLAFAADDRKREDDQGSDPKAPTRQRAEEESGIINEGSLTV